MSIALLQLYLIMSYFPVVVKKLWPYVIDCTIPDLDDKGNLISRELNYFPENNCVFLPGDLKLTNT
jgi:hypothetical protein